MNVIRWGKRKGHQRFKCKGCGLLFTWANKGVKQSNEFIWFTKWVLGRRTFNDLVIESRYSKSTLQRLFKVYLSKPPRFIIRYKTGLRLIIDGTYFSRELCLILYYDSAHRYPLYFRYSTNEFYKELKEDLQILKSLGIEVLSVTCDGKKSIIRAVRKVYEQVTLQRCTVHVQRNVRNWLTRKPKSEAAKELKYLVSLLHHIKNIIEQNMWIIAFNYWYIKHKSIIEEKVYKKQSGRWWYKHRKLRRSAISIKNAIPDLFHFIQTPGIPKSTNGLDSYFGHLKTNLKIHRGLSAVNKKSFILWFLHIKSLRL